MAKSNYTKMPRRKKSLGNPSRLTLKQRMRILSRKDLMGKARPSPLRILFMMELVFLAILEVSTLQIHQYSSAHGFATPKTDTQAQISFVGDICMGRYVESYGEVYGYDSLFTQSRELWENSDLVFANLECVILDEPEKYAEADKKVHLPASIEALKTLQQNGVNAISIANNHVVDYGREGLEYEFTQLDEINMAYAGAGRNIDEATEAKIFECGEFTVGFAAFCDVPIDGLYPDSTYVANSYDTNVFRSVREMADKTDLMIVYMHWGKENGVKLTESQQIVSHRLIESGADIVIGSHPHVLQTVEKYKDGIVFYSLGNYIFDQGSRENRNTAMVQLNIDRETGEGEFVLIPVRINNYVPQETDSPFYVNEIHRLLTAALNTDSYTVDDNDRIHIPMNFELYDEPEIS